MGLNKQQQRVFEADISRNVAVSAGAGTGKSRTLKTKVIDLITSKNIKPSEILIVTFTNEATSSLRNDIKKEVRKLGLTHLYSEVDSMHIDTLDAFRLFIVKKYSNKLKLSGNISILDASINKLEKLKILEGLLEKQYLEENPVLSEYVQEFVIKKDTDMENIIMLAADSIDVDKFTKEEFIQSYYNEFLDDNKVKNKFLAFLNNYYSEVPRLVARVRDIAENIPEELIKGEYSPNPNQEMILTKTNDLEYATTPEEIIEGLKSLKNDSGSFKSGHKFDEYDECKDIITTLKSFKTYNLFLI